jgi:hypothetical protein
MSIQAMAWAKRQKCGNPSMKAVLLAIADYADENGKAWPSQTRLAEDTELDKRTIRRALLSLEDKGYLRREEYTRSDNSRGADRIFLALSPVLVSGGGDTVSGGVGSECPGDTDSMSPLTTFEPPNETLDEPSLGSAGAPTGEIIPFKPKEDSKLNIRGTRIPDEWKPSPELVEFGASLGFTHAKTCSELASFHDHFLAATGQNSVKRDWTAAGRNWLRKAASGFGGSRGSSSSGHGSSSGGRFGAMQRALAKVTHSDPLPE